MLDKQVTENKNQIRYRSCGEMKGQAFVKLFYAATEANAPKKQNPNQIPKQNSGKVQKGGAKGKNPNAKNKKKKNWQGSQESGSQPAKKENAQSPKVDPDLVGQIIQAYEKQRAKK